MVHGDNFRIRALSQGKKHLDALVGLVFDGNHSSADHFAFHPERGIVLFWHQPEDKVFPFYPDIEGDRFSQKDGSQPLEVPIQKLPFRLTAANAADFLWAWLKEASYPEKPDIDGSSSRGFYLTTGDVCGHLGGNRYTMLALVPEWVLHGK